jgi:hypothetical protein
MSAVLGSLQSSLGGLANSSVIPVAIFLLPLSVSICTFQAIANKDSVQNYTLLSLIFGGSYLVGILGYVFLLVLYPSDSDRMSLLYALMFIVMFCFASTIAAGGVASLALDANTTVNVK